MKIEKGTAILLILLVFIASACKKDSNSTNGLYTPTSADVTASATLAELQQGRELYINNCGACHNYYLPESYTPTQWKGFISTMGPRTNMSSSETLLVTKYVCKGKQ